MRTKFTAAIAALLLTVSTGTICLGVGSALAQVSAEAPAAAQVQIPDADIGQLILQLVTNYKALGLMGSIAIALLLSVQLVKKFVPEDFKYKRLIVIALAGAYSIISGIMIPGSSVASVIITTLVSGGLAIALYEAGKGAGIFKKKAAQ